MSKRSYILKYPPRMRVQDIHVYQDRRTFLERVRDAALNRKPPPPELLKFPGPSEPEPIWLKAENVQSTLIVNRKMNEVHADYFVFRGVIPSEIHDEDGFTMCYIDAFIDGRPA